MIDNRNSTFDEWMAAVNRIVSEKCPVPLADLPDQWDFRGWYDDGGTAEDMASDVLYDMGYVKPWEDDDHANSGFL